MDNVPLNCRLECFKPLLTNVHLPRLFKEDSMLWVYLTRKFPTVFSLSKREVTLHLILIYLERVISGEGLFDPQNPSIVFCDPPLERALDVRALLTMQVKVYVIRQLVHLIEPPSPPQIHTPTIWPPWSSPVSVAVLADNKLTAQPFDIEASYWVKPAFLRELRTENELDQQLYYFPFRVIMQAFKTYLMLHSNEFFEPRNVSTAIIKNSPLASILGVHAFSRHQVHLIVRPQLDLYVEGTRPPPLFGKDLPPYMCIDEELDTPTPHA